MNALANAARIVSLGQFFGRIAKMFSRPVKFCRLKISEGAH